MPKSPGKKEYTFSLREVNCKGERILNGNMRHDTFHEIASHNLDEKGSQGRVATFLHMLDLIQRDSKSLGRVHAHAHVSMRTPTPTPTPTPGIY